MSGALLLANVMEALHWTQFIARISRPLVTIGRLNELCAASFSLAFFSATASNGLLSESYQLGKLSKKEVIFANLLNSCPTFLVHLPSQFFLTYAFLNNQAFIYTALTFFAAFIRTLFTLVAGHILLPPPPKKTMLFKEENDKKSNWSHTMRVTWERFKKRITKLIVFTVPTYCIVFLAQEAGWFSIVEAFFIKHDIFLSFLSPQAISLAVLNIAADSGIPLSAAASMAENGSLTYPQIILALLVGNILSSPMRAIRYQLPAYVGYFNLSLAMSLVCISQFARISSLVLVSFLYYIISF